MANIRAFDLTDIAQESETYSQRYQKEKGMHNGKHGEKADTEEFHGMSFIVAYQNHTVITPSAFTIPVNILMYHHLS